MSGILDHFSPRELQQMRVSGACGSIRLIAAYWSLLLNRRVSVEAAQAGVAYLAQTQWAAPFLEGDSGEPTRRT